MKKSTGEKVVDELGEEDSHNTEETTPAEESPDENSSKDEAKGLGN